MNEDQNTSDTNDVFYTYEYKYKHSSNEEDDNNANVVPDGVTSVIVDSSVTKIGRRAFMDCYSLQSIKIPPSVTRIEYGAFSGCTSLSSVILPPSLTHIGARAFSFSGLKFIVIPFSVQEIGTQAFASCFSLMTVAFSSSPSSLYPSHNPLTLTSPPPPSSSLTLIKEEVFTSCESLISITLPNHIKFVQEAQISSMPMLQNNNPQPSLFKRCKLLLQIQAKTQLPVHTWLRKRYNHLPLHQVCSDPYVSLTKIQSILSNHPNSLLQAKDDLNMTALHVLVCNPHATSEMIRTLRTVITTTNSGMNALHLYLDMYNLLDVFYDGTQKEGEDNHHHDRNNIISLQRMLHEKRVTMEWKHIDCILAIQSQKLLLVEELDKDNGEKKQTSKKSILYPFMEAAILSHCPLSIVYHLALTSLDHWFNENDEEIKTTTINITSKTYHSKKRKSSCLVST